MGLGWIKIDIILEQCWKDGQIDDEEYVDLLCDEDFERMILNEEWVLHILELIRNKEPLISVPKTNEEVYKLNGLKFAALCELDDISAIVAFNKTLLKEDSMITLPQEHEDMIQVNQVYENTFPDDIEFIKPHIDEIVTGIKKRLEGSYIWESSTIKKLWRDGMINQEECEKRLGKLGMPDSKSLWFMRHYSKTCKTGKEKTVLTIKPSNNI